MQILILTLGSRGDVQPYVALGAALGARGHDVTLATGSGFEDLIEAQGLTAASLSINYRSMIEQPEVRKALRSLPAMIKLFRTAGRMVRRQLDEMWQIARELGPELIVFHPKAFAALHIAEALKTPAIPAAVIPGFVPTDAYPSPLLPVGDLGRLGNRWSHRLMLKLMASAYGGKVRAWRRESLGLDGRPPPTPFACHLPAGAGPGIHLHGYSRHLVPRPADWGPEDVQTGYWFLGSDEAWEPPADLLDFLTRGPAPVYVGFGSMPGEGDDLTRRTVEALTASDQRGILATGWGGLAPSAADDRIFVLEAAPHAWLFPRCAAVVHHGGSGTTHEALRWGRPSIVCPLFGDQPFWGRRVQAAGAGPGPLPQRRLTAAALAGAIERALAPETAARAAALGEALREEPGAAGAAEAIERVVTA